MMKLETTMKTKSSGSFTVAHIDFKRENVEV